MTVTTMTAAPSRSQVREFGTVGFTNLLRSEWTKLRSVRSSWVSLSVAVLAMVAIAGLMGARWAHLLNTGKDTLGDVDPTDVTMSGIFIAQVVFGALGVLAISSEYGTGMIRATIGAVPQRRTMLAAKAVVITCVALVLGEVLCFVSFWLGQVMLGRWGASLSDPGVLRAVAGGGIYLAAVTLLGFGLGATVRHSAGALSSFFGILFALSALSDLLPTDLRNRVINYMPANAGSQIFTHLQKSGALAPWTGLGVFCGYAAAALIAGFVLIGVRDV